MAGTSDTDPRTRDIPFEQTPDYAGACQYPGNLKGIRIGISKQSRASIHPDEVAAFGNAIKTLKSCGAYVFDNVELSAADDWNSFSSSDTLSITIADLADSLARYFDTLVTNPNNFRTLQDLVSFIKAAPEE